MNATPAESSPVMLRFLVRAIAMLVLAAGFATLIIDGTRSIAGGGLSLTPVSELFSGRLPGIEQSIVRNVHPLLWDPVLKFLLRTPAWLALAIFGLGLLKIARRREAAPGQVVRS